MMRVALNRSKDTTTPERNCHVSATNARKWGGCGTGRVPAYA